MEKSKRYVLTFAPNSNSKIREIFCDEGWKEGWKRNFRKREKEKVHTIMPPTEFLKYFCFLFK